MTLEAAKHLDEVRSRQVRADEIRGALVYGFALEGLPDQSALFSIERLAREHSLGFFYGQGDAENADDGNLIESVWIVGVELRAVHGGCEQERGFTYTELAADIEAARTRVHAAMAVFERACGEYTSTCSRSGAKVVPTPPGLHLVASGGLALASLLKGEWVTPPRQDDEDGDVRQEALSAWFEMCRADWAKSGGGVGYRFGTEGSSQTHYKGGVRGISIDGADQSYVPVTINASTDEALDGELRAAGITEPRYFLITRYD